MTITQERLTHDVIRLRMSSWSGRVVGYDVSAYVMRGVLIDSGFPLVGAEFIRAVRELAVRGVVVTHWHEDHAGNAPLLAAAQIPLRLHPFAEGVLRERPRIGFYRRIVWGRPRRLEGALLDLPIAPLEIVETPGHTRDHVVVWDPEREIIASGDLFLGVKVRIAHIHEEPRVLVQSLRAAVALRPKLLLDAHRGPLENPVPLLQAKIDWMEEMIGEIESLAMRGYSERAIRRRVLGAEEFTGYMSFGEYSRGAFVKAVLGEGNG